MCAAEICDRGCAACKAHVHVVEILRDMSLLSWRQVKVIGESTAGSKADVDASVNLMLLFLESNCVFSTEEGKCN